MWPMMSGPVSSTTSASISPEPGIEGPPVWIVDWMPYLRAQPTIFFASSPVLTPPRPISPSSLTPASARNRKSSSSIPVSRIGAPAWTLTPPGGKDEKARCAVMPRATTPLGSRGRPGRWTSPAEIIVVTPPCMVESIQLSWFWRGVQSPNTGWTWLSISPGTSATPFASTTTSAPAVLQSASLPKAAIFPSSATTVSPSRMGFSSAPDRSKPIFLMTSFSAMARAPGSVFPRREHPRRGGPVQDPPPTARSVAGRPTRLPRPAVRRRARRRSGSR